MPEFHNNTILGYEEFAGPIDNQAALPPSKPKLLPVVQVNAAYNAVTQMREGPVVAIETARVTWTYTVRPKTTAEVNDMRQLKLNDVHSEATIRLTPKAGAAGSQQLDALTKLVQLMYKYTDRTAWSQPDKDQVTASIKRIKDAEVHAACRGRQGDGVANVGRSAGNQRLRRNRELASKLMLMPARMMALRRQGGVVAADTVSRFDPALLWLGGTLSAGNRTFTGLGYAQSSPVQTSGKWYCEVQFPTQAAISDAIGFELDDDGTLAGTYLGGDSSTTSEWGLGRGTNSAYRGLWNQGSRTQPGGGSSAVNYFSAGDSVMIAANMATGNMWWGKNGTWIQGDPATGASPCAGTGGAIAKCRFAVTSLNISGSVFTIPLTCVYPVPAGFSVF